MSTSPIAGASFSRPELLARAKNDPRPAKFTNNHLYTPGNIGECYRLAPSISPTDARWRAANSLDTFRQVNNKLKEYDLGLVDQYQGATVGDIMATANQEASDEHQKANAGRDIGYAGLGVLTGGLVLQRGGGPSHWQAVWSWLDWASTSSVGNR